MTNRQAVERFEQEAHGSQIAKLIWIASQLENHRDLDDFLEEMPDDAYEECLPEIFKSEYFEDYRDKNDMVEALINHNKLGFIAEVNIPTWHGMSFDEKGRSSTWGINGGVYRVFYVYGETTTQVLKEIEKVAARLFKEFENSERKRLKEFPQAV